MRLRTISLLAAGASLYVASACAHRHSSCHKNRASREGVVQGHDHSPTGSACHCHNNAHDSRHTHAHRKHSHDHSKHSHGHHEHSDIHSSTPTSPALAALMESVVAVPIPVLAYTSSFITAAASLVGVLLLPLPSAVSGFTGVAFLAFAAGALLADTSLHLLPHAYERSPGSAGYGVLLGVAAFFVIDRVVANLSGGSHRHGHHHHRRDSNAARIETSRLAEEEENDSDEESDEGEFGTGERQNATVTTTSPTRPGMTLRRRRGRTDTKSAPPRRTRSKTRAVGSSKSKAAPSSPVSSSSSSHTVEHDGASLHAVSAAWMNLAADALHNFCDGLAIGAAYQVSPASGISTTLAVFLHEVPQEFGDFMMLLRGGWSRRGALFANFVCGCSALVGTAASLMLGAAWDVALLPFCGGGLLFMAVGALLPELAEAVGGEGNGAVVAKSMCATMFAAAGVAVVRGIENVAHDGHSHGH